MSRYDCSRRPTTIVLLVLGQFFFSGRESHAQQPAARPGPTIGPIAPGFGDLGHIGLGDPYDPAVVLPPNVNPVRLAMPGNWLDADGQRIRSHVVRLSPDGRLVGRLSTLRDGSRHELFPAGQVTVRLMRRGLPVAVAVTDTDGVFVIPGIEEGVYSFIAAEAGRAYAAFSVNVRRPLSTSATGATRSDTNLPPDGRNVSELALDVAALPPTYVALKRILLENYPKMQRSELPPLIADDRRDPSEFDNRDFAVRDTDTNRTLAATSIRDHLVALAGDGVMRGRLYGIDVERGAAKKIQSATVYVVQDDRILIEEPVDQEGRFSVRGLLPGKFSLVAAGRDGFGAVAFELVDSPRNPFAVNDGATARFASSRRNQDSTEAGPLPAPPGVNVGQPANFAMALINDPRDLGFPVGPHPIHPHPGHAVGGGGHGHGLLGLAGLAGLAGLGGDGGKPRPVSPFKTAH